MKQKIAYLTAHIPRLPESFILREISEMERLGWQVALYPLVKEETEQDKDTTEWTNHLTALPATFMNVVAANMRRLRQSPLLYLVVWLHVVLGNLGSLHLLGQALVLFPRAVYAAEMMQAEKVTHVHAHYATQPALAAWVIYRLTGITYSLTVHTHDIFERTSLLAAKLQDAKFITAISDFNRNYLANAVGEWVKDKIYVIHCGIIPENYQQKARKLRLGRQFEIISIGSLQPHKGLRYLIEASTYLRERNIPHRCRIVGEGEQRPFLQQLITDNNLEGCVELIGAKTESEIAELLASAHCYVQPNVITESGSIEGIPFAIMEAMACGLPVVATDVAGIPEIIRHGETGYLMPPGDAMAIADALEVLYAVPEHGAQLAENGRLLLLQEFELRKNMQNLSQLFEQAIYPQPAEALA